MLGTSLPNGVTVWCEPTDPDSLIIEYPDGERIQSGGSERRRLTRLTGQLREIYEDLLTRAASDNYSQPPVKMLLKFDDVLMDLGAYGRRKLVSSRQ